MVQLDRFGDEAPARRSSRDETSSSLQGRASRLQQRVTVLEVDLAQAQSQINSLKQQLAAASHNAMHPHKHGMIPLCTALNPQT